MNPTSGEQAPPTPHKQIALAFFAFVLIGANDGTLGVVLPGIQAHYHIDKATVAFIFLANTIGYLISSFNNGLLIEKLGIRRFLMLGALLYAICALAYSLTPPFPVLLLFAIGIGSAVAAFDAGLNAYIAGLPHNTTPLNYLHAFYGLGAWLGPALASSLLALHWGWNSIYVIWSGMSLLSLIGFAAIFKPPQKSQKQVSGPQGNILTATLKLRIVWIAALMLLFYTGTEVSLGGWGFSFLTEERHEAVLIAGWMVSGYWFGLTLGRVILGYAAQRVGQTRLIQSCLFGVIVGIVLIWIAPIQAISALGLFVTGFSLGPIFPTVIALLSTLVPARILPSAIGFLMSFANIGAALCSWFAGNLAQHIGLGSLLPYEIILTIVMMGAWLSLQRRRTQAIEKNEFE